MAAGLGTRLLPMTRHTSKPMVPIVNRPALDHLVRLLASHGVTDLGLNLHYQPAEIRRYFDQRTPSGVKLRFVEERELSGTAGGTGLFRDFLLDGTFLVMSGDALTDVDLTAFLAAHKAHGGIATLAVQRIADPSLYGVVVTDADGRVTGFQEKPSPEEALSNLCNCGIYAFEPQIFDYIPAGRFTDYAMDVFPGLLRDGAPFSVWRLDTYWSDVGNLEQYRRANAAALQGLVDIEIEARELRPGIWVGEGVEVSPRAVLHAPLLLGDGCTVGDQATMIGPLALGARCTIESDTVIERSVLWDGCAVGAGASIDEAVIGRNVSVGEGARIVHGAVIADDCVIPYHSVVGGDARLEPGTVFGAPLQAGRRAR